MFLDSQIEFLCRYFGIFGLGDCFGKFFTKFGQFFPNLLVTLVNDVILPSPKTLDLA